MAEQPETWGVKRTAKLVIPATLAAAMLFYVFTTKDEQLKVSKAEGGECIVAPTESVVNVLQKRPCDESHNAEIVAAFEYPGNPLAGEPTPEENCTAVNREGLAPEDVAVVDRAMEILQEAGYPNMIVTNNADPTKKRDYVCLVVFEPRTGKFADEIFAAAEAQTPG